MSSPLYERWTHRGFNREKIYKALKSNYPDIPSSLLELKGEELYDIADRVFSHIFDGTVKGKAEIDSYPPQNQQHVSMPILKPQVNLKQRGDDERHGKQPVHRLKINTVEEAHGKPFMYDVMGHPITIIENLASVIGFDLTLFNTQVLAQSHPNIQVDIRLQRKQPGEKNLDQAGNPTWAFKSQTSQMKFSAFAKYQTKRQMSSGDKEAGEFQVKLGKLAKMATKTQEQEIKFGTNFDIMDPKKWSQQLEQFKKLPAWSRHDGQPNMISTRYSGPPIRGMNTIQLYLKAPGSRTPGHQENNNFCSMNLNVGPEDTEWFAVPMSCWYLIDALCQENGLKFLSGSWWPSMETLKALGCPYYRFLQKPGELVFVNIGCVHWVQANGVCNNIAWNLGMFKSTQYEAAMERYEWNKVEKFKSLVPMLFISWKLASDGDIRWKDPVFTRMLQKTLAKSLVDIVRIKRVLLNYHPLVKSFYRERLPNEEINYCQGQGCSEELFHLYFNLKKDGLKHYKTFCYDCAQKSDPELSNYCCSEEYQVEDLISIYNRFIVKTELWRPKA